MAAPILWVPGQIAFFLQEHLHAHKIPRFRGGVILPRGPGEASWCREANIAARQFLPLNCHAITLTAGGTFERRKKPLLWGRGNLGGILRDNLGEGNCKSKIAARQWGVSFCREASRCLAGPSGWVLGGGRGNADFIFMGAGILLIFAHLSFSIWLPDLPRVSCPLDGPNRQLPIASVQRRQSTLASHSAVPLWTKTTPTNANRAIRIAAQRTQGLWRLLCVCVFRGRYDRRRRLVIRIAPITLAGASQITRESCGCFWGLCGSSAGRFQENSEKLLEKNSRIAKCFQF